MNHEQRSQLANRLTEMFLKKYGNEVLLSGIYGSTAKGTDTEYSDLEMLFIVKNESRAKNFSFAYESMPISVEVQKMTDVEKDISKIELDWPLKMGRLFNLRIIYGDPAVLRKFREIVKRIPNEKFDEFLAKQTPLCYEGLGKLKAVKVRENTHEKGLFVEEVLEEFMLLTAILNKEFINYDYFGGLPESFRFEKLPKNYEKNARKLMKWNSLSMDETINLADEFVHNFVSILTENGIIVKEHTSLEEVDM